MVLQIYLYGSNVLREETKHVTPDYPELKQLIDNMYETMYSAEGVGLAAPQIGRALRLFVVDASPMAEEYPETEGFKKTFINPTIIETYGESFSYEEGCLSIPNIREDVVRDSVVKIKYFDEDFNEHTDVYEGIISRIVQHEYDHVEQVMFTDRVSQLKKKLLKRKLDNIKNGKNMPAYKARIN
ncbi:MAG: peptide deformylase [Prevotellaceae bacterium]|jgi:peptide deformylase|nr:peptide deformylase [Prevotellaceae bacterium]